MFKPRKKLNKNIILNDNITEMMKAMTMGNAPSF